MSFCMRRRRTARTALAVVTGLVCLGAPVPGRADVTVVHAAKTIDPSRVSVASKQAELGTDVARLFAYVRDEIRFEPYWGALRGARGTLVSQAGNSVDKALLLHELLGAAGHRSRFAHGPLDPGEAERLREAAFRLGARGPGVAPADPRVKAFLDTMQKETDERYRTVVTALADSGFVIPRGPAPPDEGAPAGLTDHYWVQVQDGSQWRNLDPTFPDAAVGRAFARLAGTPPAVPERLFHTIALRVIVEEPKEGARRQRVVLSHAARAADLSAAAVFLSHVPASWEKPVPMTALAAALAGALGAISGQGEENRTKPVLVIDAEHRVGDAFTLLSPSREGAGGGRGGAGFGGLGGLGGLLGGDDDARKNQATAEWIEIEFRSPDGKIEKVERTVFDRIGLAARRGDGGTPAGTPLGIEHPLRSLFCLSFYTGPLVNEMMFRTQDAETREAVAGPRSGEAVEVTAVLEGLNHFVSLLSDRRVSPLLASGQPVIFVHSGTRLIVATYRSTEKRATLSLDLRRARYRPLAKAREPAENGFLLQLYRGIADAVLEDQTLESLVPSRGEQDGEVAATYSANAVFREGARRGVKMVVLQKGAPPGVPGDAGARLSRHLAGGHLALRPERPVALNGKDHLAWWRIDPRTGYTLGVTGEGLHGSEEYITIVRLQSGVIRMVGNVGGRIVPPQRISADFARIIILGVINAGRKIQLNVTINR
jgi:hypothetical protein